MQIPYHPQESNYRLEIWLECLEGTGPLFVGLSRRGRQFVVAAGLSGSAACFTGVTMYERIGRLYRMPKFEINKPVHLLIDVSHTEVEVKLEGQRRPFPVFEHDDTYFDRPDWSGPDPFALSIGWSIGAFRIHRARFVALPEGDVAKERPFLLAPPDDAEVQTAIAAIRKRLGRDYRAATSKLLKRQLADRLQSQADDAQGLQRYALLTEAATVYWECQGFHQADKMIENMGKEWRIDVLSRQVAILSQAAKRAQSSDDAYGIDAHAAHIASNARWWVRDDILAQLFSLSTAMREKITDPALAQRVDRNWRDKLSGLDHYGPFARAKATLKKSPDDGDAHLACGVYYSLQGYWDEAVPHFAKCSDPRIAELAQRDLAAPQSEKEYTALADELWDIALAQEGHLQTALKLRACCWYRQIIDWDSSSPHLDAPKARCIEMKSAYRR